MSGPIKFRRSYQDFGWLSNLFPAKIRVGGFEYNSSEQLYKKLKCLVTRGGPELLDLMASSGDDCRKLVKQTPPNLEKKWSAVKFEVMIACQYLKFSQNGDLRERLLKTGNQELLENTPDPQWGVGQSGRGKNLCGRALMEVRKLLKNPDDGPFSAVILSDSMLKEVMIPNVANLAFPGSKISYIETLLPVMAKLPCVKKIILLSGTNSISDRWDNPNFRVKQLSKKLIPIIDQIRKERSELQIQIYSCFDRMCDIKFDPLTNSFTLGEAALLLRKWNENLQKYSLRVNSPQNLTFVNVQNQFSHTELYSSDLLHLNQKGVRMITTVIQHWLTNTPETSVVISQ